MRACVASAVLIAIAMAGCGGGSTPPPPPPPPPPPAATATATVATSGLAESLAAFSYPGPSCRRDVELAAAVQSALTRILESLHRTSNPVALEAGAAVPWKRVALNDGGIDAEALHLEIVRDAAADAVDASGCPSDGVPARTGSDPDERTVGGLCEALPVKGVGVIRCSADGLAALTAEDRRRLRSSPALTYVLAHELSHLAHGDGRNFLPAVKVVDLAIPPDAKWKIVSTGCDVRGSETARTLGHEQRADRDAMKILQDVVLADAQQDATQSAAVSVARASMATWVSAEAVKGWSRRWQHGAALPPAIVDAPLAPDAAYVRWSVDRVLCDVLTKTSGYALVLSYNDTHPSEPERLALISTELARIAPSFHSVPGPLPEEAQEMMARLAGINAIVDVQQRTYFDAFGAELCQRTSHGQRPVCEQISVAPPIPTPTCPRFDASLSDQDSSLTPTSLAARIGADGSVEVGGAVRVALPLSRGRLFVGTTSPNLAAIVTPSGTTAWQLPCTPVSALERPAGVSVLCEAPFGIVTLTEAGEAHARFATNIMYDGEPVDTGALRAGWLGSVKGILHATMRLPMSGKSTTIRFDVDGARSAKPWRGTACGRLFAGMNAFHFDPGGPVFGANWNSSASSMVARFDPHFEGMQAFAHPTGKPHPFACGDAKLWKTLVCADAGGAIFDPFAGDTRKALLRFTPSPVLARARKLSGRVCSTSKGLYVQAIGHGDGTEINEVFAAKDTRSGFKKIFSEPRSDVTLSCGAKEAVLVVPGGSTTKILLF